MRGCWSLQQNLVDRLASLPGVSSVSLMNGLPMTGFSSQDPIFASDHSYAADTIPPLRRFIRVAPGAFQVLGTPLAAGREYDWTDHPPEAPGRADQRELRPRILGLGGGGDRQAHSLESERSLERGDRRGRRCPP